MPDVSDALHKLLNDLVKQVPRMALHDSNAFRRNLMYTEGVDAILRKHEGMLHGLFDIFALEPPPCLSDEPNPFATKDGLSWDEWNQLVDALDFVDRTFSRRDVGNVYIWSRLWAFDDGSIGARRKVTNLFFEDFLECLVRIATMKSLPSMEEIIYAGFSDCGDYLIDLKGTGALIELKEATVSEAYDAFCQSHPASWDVPPTQDTEDLVEHLLLLMKRTIEATLGKPPDKDLGRRDFVRFKSMYEKRLLNRD